MKNNPKKIAAKEKKRQDHRKAVEIVREATKIANEGKRK